MQLIFSKKSYLILIHLLIGYTFIIFPDIIKKIFFLSLFTFFIVDIIIKKNKNDLATIYAFYIVSAEVFFRMSGSFFLYEFGKYSCMLVLLLGMLSDKEKRGIPILFLLYLLLITVGVSYSEIPPEMSFRKAWLFNLSGPLVLGVSGIYYYKRSISLNRIKIIFWYAILPMFSMLTYLFFKTPSLKEITFGTGANFKTSGGFGPNQVSTALGLGTFLVASLLILKSKVTKFFIVDIILLIYLFYRTILTFSRGGLITGVIAMIVLVIFYLVGTGKLSKLLIYASFFVAIIFASWFVVDNITSGMITNRYLGKNAKGIEKEDISSGRVDIFKIQFESFMKHPILGIGVGSGKYHREKNNAHVTAASHNEVSRLLEEHGLVGGFSLLLTIYLAFKNFINQQLAFKGIVASFALLWFLTINHSAMRIAFPGFIYGLSLIHIYKEKDE